jgi:hypothetical protein
VSDISVSGQGASALKQLAATMRAIGGQKLLAQELTARLANATSDVKQAVAASAMSTLPAGGGLNAYVAAAQVVTQVRTSGSQVGVRIQSSRSVKGAARLRKTRAAASHGTKRAPKGILLGHGNLDMAGLDAGMVHHPTYGHRPWKTTDVTAGFWTNVMTGPVTAAARQTCIGVIVYVAEKLASAAH